jgi:hypothetical protein
MFHNDEWLEVVAWIALIDELSGNDICSILSHAWIIHT